MIQRMRHPKREVRIAIVGKYVELHDAYMSVKEALFHAASSTDAQVEIRWVHSGELERGRGFDQLADVDGIVVPGGFGHRGMEGKIMAARYARERGIPYLGLCLGMQAMCIEFGRNVANLEDANSSEFEVATEHPVIDLMSDQVNITDMGGTMRLGIYPCVLQPGSVAYQAYGEQHKVDERHRHRFEFNNKYRADFTRQGMRFSGLSPDSLLVEIAEVADHPFMVGTQFHPEFLSRPNRPHPLFVGFVKASLDLHDQRADGDFADDGQVDWQISETTDSQSNGHGNHVVDNHVVQSENETDAY
jgi:CTP synthase